ncbi:30S ribosomal protein S14 [Candidatus Phytoplasma tritici]|uniref:30S ribosomal protein S14 n=1 Tax=Candidatus Phytoplasma tritici TaxID=321961 RepID=UPI00042890A9|nr:30S ribosomal protein S14 [Candidatus Phytoplasma tritici]
MAKKSKIVKDQKQRELVLKYAKLRLEFKKKADYVGLSQIPAKASPVRLKNRDSIDGRPRGYIRKFGISRINFRQLAHQGKLPGVRKTSW